MKKIFQIFLLVTASLVIANWTKQASSPQYCYGKITLAERTKEGSPKVDELKDIRIGSSKDLSDNKGITVYRKPQDKKTRPEDYIEYMFDLNKISKIEVVKEEPIFKYDDTEYVNILVTSSKVNEESKPVACIIPKEKEIIGKLKTTGWTASYPFDKILKLEMQQCVEKDDNNK